MFICTYCKYIAGYALNLSICNDTHLYVLLKNWITLIMWIKFDIQKHQLNQLLNCIHVYLSIICEYVHIILCDWIFKNCPYSPILYFEKNHIEMLKQLWLSCAAL